MTADPHQVDPKVQAEIDNKNFHWWHRYRAVNGFSIYGARGLAGSDGTYNNRDVMERERAILDQMTAIRDARIWAVASGESVPDEIDDSDTLPFINPKTNVGGPDDKERKRGKLGSLDYRTAAEQQKLFKLHDGFEIQLVASEEQFPELANPVALNFDNKGRLWVATMQSYPHWKPKTKLDDKILIFEDTRRRRESRRVQSVLPMACISRLDSRLATAELTSPNNPTFCLFRTPMEMTMPTRECESCSDSTLPTRITASPLSNGVPVAIFTSRKERSSSRKSKAPMG